MNIKKEEMIGLRAIKFIVEEDGRTIGRAYLYLINNSLHKEPFGLLEDMEVEEEYRGKGIGKRLMEVVIGEAKARGCYKLVAQSRYSNTSAHSFYEKMGFNDHGKNFRIDF